MLTIPGFVLPILVLGCGAAGFAFGMLHERWNWNALIRDGRLPRPTRAR